MMYRGTTLCHCKFTGKERDTESGLDYFGARYYGSSMGRFMSPDWSAQAEPVPYAKLGYPQSLNLYSYMLNNPHAGVDADGHWPQWLSSVGQSISSGWHSFASTMNEGIAGAWRGMVNDINAAGQGDPAAMARVLGGGMAGAATPIPEFGGSTSVSESVVAPVVETESATSSTLISDSALAGRANVVQAAQDAFGQPKSTTAAASVTDANGNTAVMVGSSRNALPPSQRAALQPGEIAVTASGHAETTVINAAKSQGMTVN